MMKETTITILRAVAKHGPVSTGELDALKIPGFASGCKSNIGTLLRTLEMIEPWDFQGNRQRYVIADKGERLLKALDAAAKVPEGKMPAPRTAVEFVPLKWKPMEPPREASTQHEKCNSVWNGEVTPYTRPRSNSGRAMVAVGMHGGVQ